MVKCIYCGVKSTCSIISVVDYFSYSLDTILSEEGVVRSKLTWSIGIFLCIVICIKGFLISVVDNRFYTAGVVSSILTGSIQFYFYIMIFYKNRKTTKTGLKHGQVYILWGKIHVLHYISGRLLLL